MERPNISRLCSYESRESNLTNARPLQKRYVNPWPYILFFLTPTGKSNYQPMISPRCFLPSTCHTSL